MKTRAQHPDQQLDQSVSHQDNELKAMSRSELLSTCKQLSETTKALRKNVDRLTKNMAIMQEYIGLLNQQKFGKKADQITLPEGMEQLYFFNKCDATADETH